MTPSLKLAAFAGALALLGGASYAAGNAAGSSDEPKPEPTPQTQGHGGHPVKAAPVGITGLAVSDGTYALRPTSHELVQGSQDFRFVITAADGTALTAYDETHERDLHLIVVRRDLTGFQHLHPTRADDGTWSVSLRLDSPGPYRVFADFAPKGQPPRALGVDVVVPGDYRPAPTTQPQRLLSEAAGYEVAASGRLQAKAASTLTFAVRRDGRPVTELEPYLGARGHLVVLRVGDLAYLHVHPDSDRLAFTTTVPSVGGYAGFLDTKHGGVVRTADFRFEATR